MINNTLPLASDAIKWYHHLLATPLRAMSRLNLGPLGGKHSISAIIETVIAQNKGETITFPLSKSERFFVEQLTKTGIPDEMIEYRELSHEAQRHVLERWGERNLGIIWLGAGVFTLDHPLLAQRKIVDWHIWSDASPKIVESASNAFEEVREKMGRGKLAHHIELPRDISHLNRTVDFIGEHVNHIVFFGYGVTYALTVGENYQWLSRLQLPDKVDASFVFNAPGESLPLLPGIMAAFHEQRMVYYTQDHIKALFNATIPGSELVWEKPRSATRNKIWATWIIHAPANKRKEQKA